MTATALGAYLEIAFQGDYIRLHFDVKTNRYPYPHLWLRLDGGAMIETPLDKYLRVNCTGGSHVLQVILKSSVEVHPRFYHPLVSKLSFLGYEAEGNGVLPPDLRKTIEFVGDSITEGVQMDPQLESDDGWELSRPIHDDVTATYAWLTAENLNLRDLHMGYGAVGVLREGQGGVPTAARAYPYCFDGAKVLYDHPDYILINHGASDQFCTEEEYASAYRDLLHTIRELHPQSVIICLSAFYDVHPDALREMIAQWNAQREDRVHFIDSTGWIPQEPLHPMRDGHRIIAEHLAGALKSIVEQ